MYAWSRRHRVWSTVIALFVVLVIIGAATSQAPPAKTANTAATTSQNAAPAQNAAPQSAASTPARPALSCHAQATRLRPRDHTSVGIRVHTAAHIKVTAKSPRGPVTALSSPGRASAQGNRLLRFLIGAATPGIRIVIVVRVSGHSQTSTCRASFRPKAAPVAVVKAPAPPQPPQPAPPPPPSPAPPPPPPTKASCHPLSNEGTCYEPGEFCRDSDHGVTGVAGDGETITCADNDGWRWEPS
jgi:hypothetical protein